MDQNIIGIFEDMAMFGTAPEDGCSLFGVGYDDVFARLKDTYLVNRFTRGGSAEKFVVGPFGSGKTHFLHQLMEVARDVGCVTAKVTLNKDIDFTQSLIVYKEVIRELRSPLDGSQGVRSLLIAIVEHIRKKAPNKSAEDILLLGWISGLDKVDFKLDVFAKVVKVALMAYVNGDEAVFEAATRWIAGEINDKALASELRVPQVTKSEHNLFAKRALLSLFQLVKHAGFQGTVLCFDEAEQGFSVDKKRSERILSMLMAGINAVVDLKKGSALITYALTPDLIAKMETFAALQQRVADPGAGNGFFDGNTLAPLIDLSKRADPVKELQAIGNRLVDLLYQAAGEAIAVNKQEVLVEISNIADNIASEDISTSNRRTMVKHTCTMLINLLNTGIIQAAVSTSYDSEEDEV